jgi:hypothetical protein
MALWMRDDGAAADVNRYHVKEQVSALSTSLIIVQSHWVSYFFARESQI